MIVTDDLASFRKVAEKLGLERQVCQFHVRRWVGRTIHKFRDSVPKEWLWVLDEIQDLLAELPEDCITIHRQDEDTQSYCAGVQILARDVGSSNAYRFSFDLINSLLNRRSSRRY